MNSKRKITYIGYVGHNNVGDEALFKINKKIFREYQLTPDNIKQHSQITLFGGGTLLPEWPSYMLKNKYNYAFGVGVRDSLFWGKYPPFIINQVKNFNFKFIGVRDYRSKEILSDWGIKSEVIGDPCLLFQPKKTRRNRKRIIINIDCVYRLWGKNEKDVFKEISKLCIILNKNEYSPILLPMLGESIPYLKEIAKKTKTPIFHDWKNIERTLELIASSNILIGEKLHSIIFSALTYTPFISLEYRPKCSNFAKTIGFKNQVIKTNELNMERLNLLIENTIENWRHYNKKLTKVINLFRKKIISFSSLIKNDIDSLPTEKWIAPNFQIIRRIPITYRSIIWPIRNKIWKLTNK